MNPVLLIFPTSGRVYVWRKPKEAFNPDYLLPTVKHGGGLVMVWAAISWSSLVRLPPWMVGSISKITRAFWAIRCIQCAKLCFLKITASSRTIMPRSTLPISVQNWFQEHETELGHVEWPPQSPNLNIIEHQWCILDRQVRNRYSPPSRVQELEQVLMVKWLKIPLEEFKKLYDSIPRRIAAVFKAKGGPTPY